MSEANPQRQRRRKYLLDPGWQLSIFRNVAVVALLVGLLQMVGTYAVASQDPLDRWSGQQIGFLAFATNGLFLALVFFALWMVSLRVTHAVVGPAKVIQEAVDGLIIGDFDRRLTLRQRDYLQALASSVKELSEHLKEQAEAAAELQVALTEGDYESALELVRRFQKPAEDPICAA